MWLSDDGETVRFKVLLWGPAQAGTSTFLRALPERLGALVTDWSVPEQTEAYVQREYVTITFGSPIKGKQVTLDVVGCEGAREYVAPRLLAIKDADAVVFVADAADPDAAEPSLAELRRLLGERIFVLFYNKQDLPGIVDADELDARWNRDEQPSFVGVATEGIGVRDTMIAVTKLLASTRL